MDWSDPEDQLPLKGSAAARGRLLVVDDDEANRDLLSRRLTRKGYEVITAEGGRQALERVAAHPLDVVLLDVMMPEMSGLDTLTVLRQTYGPTELPVIMATARDQSEDVVEALRLGANDYVTKPLDFPVVLARLQTQLSMKQAVDEAARLEASLAERNRELEQLNAQLEASNRRVAHDLKAAARVQESFLPRARPRLPGARCAWVYRPCEELAGDGLSAFPLDDRRAALYVFDVCGHGVASALLSVSLSRVLSPPGNPASVLTGDEPADGSAPALTPPAEVAEHLNRMFPFEQSEQYFTLIYAILDAQAGLLRYVSAGHPGLILLPAAGPPALLDGRGFPVGLAQVSFEEQTVTVGPGDRVFLYSDGIPEADNGRGEVFGWERLLGAVERGRDETLPRATEALVAEVDAWSQAAGHRDDISLLAVEINRPETTSPPAPPGV